MSIYLIGIMFSIMAISNKMKLLIEKKKMSNLTVYTDAENTLY